jgi:hypothetical protein
VGKLEDKDKLLQNEAFTPFHANAMSLPQHLNHVADLLAKGRQGEINAASLCKELRALQPHFAVLPERFQTFFDTAVTRLESGSLFSEESCSFSQKELLDALGAWEAKARGL